MRNARPAQAEVEKGRRGGAGGSAGPAKRAAAAAGQERVRRRTLVDVGVLAAALRLRHHHLRGHKREYAPLPSARALLVAGGGSQEGGRERTEGRCIRLNGLDVIRRALADRVGDLRISRPAPGRNEAALLRLMAFGLRGPLPRLVPLSRVQPRLYSRRNLSRSSPLFALPARCASRSTTAPCVAKQARIALPGAHLESGESCTET